MKIIQIVTFGEGEGRAYFHFLPRHLLPSERFTRRVATATFLYNLMTTFPRIVRVWDSPKNTTMPLARHQEQIR